MDCKTARLLLEFARPLATELEAADAQALEQHLSTCGECEIVAYRERDFDQQVGLAMRAVPIPIQLRENVLRRVQLDQRGDRQRRWLLSGIAVAAALLLAVWGITALRHRTTLDLVQLSNEVENFDNAPSKVELAEKWFREQGFEVTLPDRFNYDLLAFYSIGDFHGHATPQLVFVTTVPQGVVHARVFILSEKQFDLKNLREQESLLSGSVNVAVWTHPNDRRVAYLIVYKGDALTPFLTNQQQPAA